MSNWALSNKTVEASLSQAFTKRGISTAAPGFYDDAAFLDAERRNPRFLELYARFVEARNYTAEYLDEAKSKTLLVSEAVRSAIEKDGRQGACVDASTMISRMLDRVGVWNYVAKSTLTITFPKTSGLDKQYFWAVDIGHFTAPHAIVVAPPFGVVDVTVKYQLYEANQATFLPEAVYATEFGKGKWDLDDLVSATARHILKADGYSPTQYLRSERKSMLEVAQALPPRITTHGETSFKYVLIAVGGSEEPLEGLTGYKPDGRSALQIFGHDVLPRL